MRVGVCVRESELDVGQGGQDRDSGDMCDVYVCGICFCMFDNDKTGKKFWLGVCSCSSVLCFRACILTCVHFCVSVRDDWRNRKSMRVNVRACVQSCAKEITTQRTGIV